MPASINSKTLTRRALLASAALAPVAASITSARAHEGSATPGASPAAGGPWVFTDDRRGVTVTLPAAPTRIVAQVSAAATLWDYGIEPIAIFGPHVLPDGSQDPQSGAVDLTRVEALGNAWGEFDLEKFIELKPDLLVAEFYDPAALWYVPDEALVSIEALGIPTIGFLAQDVPIDSFIDRWVDLAGALGADLASAENVAAFEAFDLAELKLKEAIAAKPDLTVAFLAAGPEIVYIANPLVARDLIYYANLGLDIVGEVGAEFWDPLSWEEVNKYPVDLIFNDARSQSLQPEQMTEFPSWNLLPAVQAGQVSPWFSETTFSHKGFTTVLDAMTIAITNAQADLV